MATLKTEDRDLGLTQGELNKLRKMGKIPAVVYGKGRNPSTPIFVNLVEFMKIYHDTGKIMEMNVGGSTEMVNAKVIDRSPMGNFQHINFHQLKRGQKTQVKVPVHADGEAKGVKEGGVLSIVHEVLVIEAKPKDIPESIHVDVSELAIGDTLTAGQIKLAAGLELVDDPEMAVISIQAPQKEEPEPEAAAAEGEEAPAAEAAPAEAAAEGEAEKKSE